jgi:hypothetical protein
LGYAAGERGGFRNDVSGAEQIGDGGLYSTVDDLLRFAERSDDVRATAAASAGGSPGYRAALVRQAAAHAAVAVLCNDGSADAAGLAAELAAIWLADAARPAAPAPAPAPSAQTPSAQAPSAAATPPPLWKFVGMYRTAETGEIVRFAIDDGVLTLVAGTARRPLARVAADRFAAAGAQWRFDDNLAIETDAGRETIYAAFKPLAAPVAPPAAYAGDYVSPELPNALFRIVADARGLRLVAKNLPPMRLSPTVADEFAADGLPLVLRFARDRRGFWLYAGRPGPTLSDLPFRRRQ